MLRRPPTTLQLDQEDVADLIAELEEEKLQLQIKSQRMNLVRSSTGITDTNNERISSEHDKEPGSFQVSPLAMKKQAVQSPNISVSDTNALLNRDTETRNNQNIDFNPFYNESSQN